MKLLIALSAVWLVAQAMPTILSGGPVYFTETIPARTQFVAQDAIGQYSYGYSGESAARSETKSIDGVTRGAYTYVDSDGKLQSVEYTADAANGFRASATNLPRSPVDDGMAPESVQETEEVAKARAEHLAAFREAEIRAANAPENGEGEEEANAEEGNGEENGEVADSASVSSQVPASTSAAAPGTIAVSAPLATVRTISAIPTVTGFSTVAVPSPLAASSYSYQIDTRPDPAYSYSVATPAYAAPTNAIIATAPVIARSRVELIPERRFDINGHLTAF